MQGTTSDAVPVQHPRCDKLCRLLEGSRGRTNQEMLQHYFADPTHEISVAASTIDMKSENIVALCDVDWAKAAGTFQAFPNAERFKDYRVLLERRNDIDAVMIATPDHMHAPITLAALRAGKHFYVDKPMAHTIEETRVMTTVARETGLVTQMGNNGHAGEGLRLTREWIQAGAASESRQHLDGNEPPYASIEFVVERIFFADQAQWPRLRTRMP